MRKLKVLFHSNSCSAATGFGSYAREILTYLHKTGKYELAILGAGRQFEDEDAARWPWKSYGTVPNDPNEINNFVGNGPDRQAKERLLAYGAWAIDKVIADFKPDIYVGVEDPWGIDYCIDKQWWNKIHTIVHTTVDSLPILPTVEKLAKNADYFYSWAKFAVEPMRKMGLKNVSVLHGTVNTNDFQPLSYAQKKELRKKYNIPENAFCIGMNSRNQLRKSFVKLIQAYKKFKIENPKQESRLLFFTDVFESSGGWDIMKWVKSEGVNPKEVLAFYKCRATNRTYIMPYEGQDLKNPDNDVKIDSQIGSLHTAGIHAPATTEEINEWYNILDVYAHPFTSGGQERTIQEAKLCTLITLVTNYSCGEDMCVPEAESIPLRYTEAHEAGTNFIKAATDENYLARMLTRVLKLPLSKRKEMGAKARQWTLDNYSIEVIGSKMEAVLDSCELIEDYDYILEESLKDLTVQVDPHIFPDDNQTFVKYLYRTILDMDVTDDNDGLKVWLNSLEQGYSRESIIQFFRGEAVKHNQKIEAQEILNLNTILEDSPDNRVLFNMPESLGDMVMVTSLLKDLREQYADKKIYFATNLQYQNIIKPLVGKYIDKVILWQPIFDDQMTMEGYRGKKYFHVVLNPHFATQRYINYLNNGDTRSAIDLQYFKYP